MSVSQFSLRAKVHGIVERDVYKDKFNSKHFDLVAMLIPGNIVKQKESVRHITGKISIHRWHLHVLVIINRRLLDYWNTKWKEIYRRPWPPWLAQGRKIPVDGAWSGRSDAQSHWTRPIWMNLRGRDGRPTIVFRRHYQLSEYIRGQCFPQRIYGRLHMTLTNPLF